MLLSARFLLNLGNVNTYEISDTAFEMTQGDSPVISFQLIDASLDPPSRGFYPSGRRYVPAAGATLSAQLTSIDSGKTVTRAATQPFPTSDPSIWQLTLLSTDAVSGTLDLVLTLTEGSKVTYGRLRAAIRADGQGCL